MNGKQGDLIIYSQVFTSLHKTCQTCWERHPTLEFRGKINGILTKGEGKTYKFKLKNLRGILHDLRGKWPLK
jgi:hypothetical protein